MRQSPSRQIGADRLESRRIARKCCTATLSGVSPSKRRPAGQHFVAGDAERIEIAARIDAAPLNLLGTHVERRPERDANLRQPDRLPFARDPRQAKIGDFHLAGLGQHDVLRLDIAVDDPLLRRTTQRGNHLPHDVHGRGSIRRAVTRQPLFQVLTGHVLLSNEMDAIDATHFVNLHDIGMHQRGGRPGFVVKTPHIGLVFRQGCASTP